MTLAPAIALGLALGSAAPAPALVVHARADAPDAERLTERLAAAIAGRMPALRVVAEGAAGQDDLLVALAPIDVRWLLTVRRAGAVVLERALPAESGPDAAFLDACALVLERFLQEIDWKGKPEAIDPNAVARAPTPIELPPAPPPPIDFAVGVAGEGAFGETGGGRVGPALEVTARRKWLIVGLRANLYAPAVTPVTDPFGSTSEQVHDLPTGLAAMGGWCSEGQPYFCVGAEVGWRGTWAWSTSMYSSSTIHTDSFLGGLFGIAAVRLPYQFEARAMLTALGFAGAADITVETLPALGKEPSQASIVSPPHLQLGLALGLARQVP